MKPVLTTALDHGEVTGGGSCQRCCLVCPVVAALTRPGLKQTPRPHQPPPDLFLLRAPSDGEFPGPVGVIVSDND
ncbi:hypothetical protein NHX12_007921, partial [Muraenolepis orangiensis]